MSSQFILVRLRAAVNEGYVKMILMNKILIVLNLPAARSLCPRWNTSPTIPTQDPKGFFRGIDQLGHHGFHSLPKNRGLWKPLGSQC